MKFKIKIIKKGTSCFIKLPDQFCEDMELEKCEELIGKTTPSGSLELKRPMDKGELCMICHKRPHRDTKCINCGKYVCSGCYWELGGLCHDCLGKKKKGK
jgi:hypothetical protein